MENRSKAIIQGILWSNIAGLAILIVSILCTRISSRAGVLVASNFVIIPLLMGMISAYFWEGALQRTREYAWYSLINTFVAIGLSSIFLMEGVICLVIVFPILFGFVMAGAMISRTMISKNRKIGIHITPVVLLLLVGDSLSPPIYSNAVTDTLQINAPSHVVWKYVPSFPPIEHRSRYWLFSLGLAEPIETQIEGPFVGAWRKCVFTGGLTFEERISEYRENQAITFEVTKQPKDPEIFDHVSIDRGQMSLHDNGDGTTTLTGTTWYQLHAFPAWYYKRWADSIGRAVHLQVMHHIKDLSEQDYGSP